MITEERDFGVAICAALPVLWGVHTCENDRGVPGRKGLVVRGAFSRTSAPIRKHSCARARPSCATPSRRLCTMARSAWLSYEARKKTCTFAAPVADQSGHELLRNQTQMNKKTICNPQ
jgi:hypothetical protein